MCSVHVATPLCDAHGDEVSGAVILFLVMIHAYCYSVYIVPNNDSIYIILSNDSCLLLFNLHYS